ncbi:MAG TPA: dCTP deaminase [Methanocorpusculum sp.]|nr:dCTP deaminase [Methanocorpusculum sp.]
MILSSSAIRERISDNSLNISPFTEECLQPSSYDLRVDTDCILKRGEFTLVSTMEFICLPPDLAATLRTRSSFGRKGILLGAGYIDPGFRGNLTLSLVNMGPEDISIKKGTRIVQMLIHTILGNVEKAYNGNYQDSHGIIKSKI